MERNNSVSKKLELSRRGATTIAVALGSIAAVGFGFNHLSTPDDAPAITCEGVQDISVEAGQTYGEIIDQYVETTGVRADELPNLVGGIAAEQPLDYDGTAFGIKPGDYSDSANTTQVLAGENVTIPAVCS